MAAKGRQMGSRVYALYCFLFNTEGPAGVQCAVQHSGSFSNSPS